MAQLNARYVVFAMVLLCLTTISKSEYVWNGKEWTWKESVTESIVDASGEEMSTLNDYEIIYENYENSNGSGDGTLSDGEELEGPTQMSTDNEKEVKFEVIK